MQTLERIRRKIGVSHPQMLKLIGAKTTRRALLTAGDHAVDPVFMERALTIERYYDEWKRFILQKVEERCRRGPLSLADLGEVFGQDRQAFYQQKRRSRIEFTRLVNARAAAITPQMVRDLFHDSETLMDRWPARAPGRAAVRSLYQPIRSPLSDYFLQYLTDLLQRTPDVSLSSLPQPAAAQRTPSGSGAGACEHAGIVFAVPLPTRKTRRPAPVIQSAAALPQLAS